MGRIRRDRPEPASGMRGILSRSNEAAPVASGSVQLDLSTYVRSKEEEK
jgi:hypothetical protein